MYQLEPIETLIKNELQGLCANCINASQCAYRNSTNKIIIQCELHQLKGVKVVEWFGPEMETKVDHSNQSMGLCMNCALAKTCRLPDRHLGVWHCEEYA